MTMESETIKQLPIPGIVIPAIREMKINFIVFITFDILFGPIVYLKEFNPGSQYLSNLTTYESLTEIYAELQASSENLIPYEDETILILRYKLEDQLNNTTLLILSCDTETDVDKIKDLANKALISCEGDQRKFGRSLSTTIRKKLIIENKIQLKDNISYLFYWDENRIKKPLNNKFIKGIAIFDYETKHADVRNLSTWINDKIINPRAFIHFLDNQIESIIPNASTSLLFQNIPFLATKINKKDVYIIIQISDNGISLAKEISEWFNPYAQILGSDWKNASAKEIEISTRLFEEVKLRKSPIQHVLKYAMLLIRCQRIRPSTGNNQPENIDPPWYIEKRIWQSLLTLSGTKTIEKLIREWDVTPLEVVTLLEWARIRNIVIYLEVN